MFAPMNTDGYKLGHYAMYADGTTQVYSNLTPRSDKIYRRQCSKFYDGKIAVVGVQGALTEIRDAWHESFFGQSKRAGIRRYKQRVDAYLGEGVVAVEHMEALHDLGYLPILVKALPEGSLVSPGTPILTITNTIPEFYWIVNYLETAISNLIWKMCTNATIAREYQRILRHYGGVTGTDAFTVKLQAHDFSCRGMSGPEDAARSGFAHLTSSYGTDTLLAMDYAEYYYGHTPSDGILAISVPATEHAVSSNNILSIQQNAPDGWNSRLAAEQAFMKDLVTRKYPAGVVSYVADTYDFWGVIEHVLPALRSDILDRRDDPNGLAKLVIRPDSGNPVDVLCGIQVRDADTAKMAANMLINDVLSSVPHGEPGPDTVEGIFRIDGKLFKVVVELEWNRYDKTYYFCDGHKMRSCQEAVLTVEQKGLIEALWDIFGGTVTAEGYKMLDRHIGAIYGDSITVQRCEEILARLAQKGFASGNVFFGVGSYTYQCNTRDTFGFAVKATHSVVAGQPVAIFKEPKTDSGKKSARGLLAVTEENGGWVVHQDVSPEEEQQGALEPVFVDGCFIRRTTLKQIRDRLDA